MSEVMTAFAVAAGAFVSTNVDDVVVLATFFSKPQLPARNVVIGQYLGIGALVALSLLGAAAIQFVPTEWTRWLGLLPIAIGLKWLYEAHRGDRNAEVRDLRSGSGVLTVAGVTFANGGDNLGVYIPLMAGFGGMELAVTAVAFALLTGVWCSAGYALVRNPVFGEHVRRLGQTLAAFVLISIGLAILFELL